MEHQQSQEALALAREGVEHGVQASYTHLLTSYTEATAEAGGTGPSELLRGAKPLSE